MSVEQMRCAVSDAYKHSSTWSNRVKSMPDNQIIALYYKFRANGKIK